MKVAVRKAKAKVAVSRKKGSKNSFRLGQMMMMEQSNTSILQNHITLRRMEALIGVEAMWKGLRYLSF